MRRPKLEVISCILNVTKQDSLKNHIIQKCGLSNRQFEKYVLPLIENGFMHGFPAVNLRNVTGPKTKHRMIYSIATPGKQLLKLSSQLCTLVDRGVAIILRTFLSFSLSVKDVASSLHRQR